MKTIGVVIVCYGDRFYLEESQKAFKSVVGQTVLPDEIRVVYSKNGKLHSLINDAVRNLSTDYFIRLDADDYLSKDYIECFQKATGDILKPYIVMVDEKGGALTERHQLPDKPLNQGNHIVSSAPIRRDLFLEIGGYNEHPILEDYDLFIRLSLYKNAKIGKMNGTLYYMQRPGKTRNTIDPDGWKYNLVLIDKYYGAIKPSISEQYTFF